MSKQVKLARQGRCPRCASHETWYTSTDDTLTDGGHIEIDPDYPPKLQAGFCEDCDWTWVEHLTCIKVSDEKLLVTRHSREREEKEGA